MLSVATGQTVTVRDGVSREYLRLPVTDSEAAFIVGALGTHILEV